MRSLGVCCLGWNVTVIPPWYVAGAQETDVQFEAFPPSLHHRAKGRVPQAPPGRQGPGIGPVQRGGAAAQRVLSVAAPADQRQLLLPVGDNYSCRLPNPGWMPPTATAPGPEVT